jgi:hypothetical protein
MTLDDLVECGARYVLVRGVFCFFFRNIPTTGTGVMPQTSFKLFLMRVTFGDLLRGNKLSDLVLHVEGLDLTFFLLLSDY